MLRKSIIIEKLIVAFIILMVILDQVPGVQLELNTYMVYLCVLGGFRLLILLVILIPKYGMFAAAWVTTATLATKNIIGLYFVNKLIYSKTGQNSDLTF